MNKKLDPRAIKTRQQIVDAFQQLIQTKHFEQITVKHITELAHINRATFYAHFIDKYELLEMVLNARTYDDLAPYFDGEVALDNQLLEKLLLSIMSIHEQMNSSCRRGYDTFSHMILKKKLKADSLNCLRKNYLIRSSYLRCSLVGVYTERMRNGHTIRKKMTVYLRSALLYN